MERFIEMRDARIVAVGGEQVLDEIVGADGEKVDLPDEPRRQPYRRGHLDHDADLDAGIVLEPLAEQLALGLGEQLARAAQLLEGRDHRKQDLYLVMHGGAQDGAKLDLEQTRQRER